MSVLPQILGLGWLRTMLKKEKGIRQLQTLESGPY